MKCRRESDVISLVVNLLSVKREQHLSVAFLRRTRACLPFIQSDWLSR